MEIKYSKYPNSDDDIIKMLSREEEMQKNDGKWVSGEKIHKNKKAYNRKKMPKIEENNEE